jgi:hypothetical protein
VEAVRARTAPAGIVLGEPDLILAIGAAVAEELYDVQLPILVVSLEELARIGPGDPVRIGPEGLTSP